MYVENSSGGAGRREHKLLSKPASQILSIKSIENWRRLGLGSVCMCASVCLCVCVCGVCIHKNGADFALPYAVSSMNSDV